MKKLRVLDLFSGIGGFSLGLERTGGFETVAFCEYAEFPRKVLKKHWPDVPIYPDIRELTAERLDADGLGPVDIITGGYPCQPFSHAGKRLGAEDDRHLWPEMRRLIETLRPAWVIGENVAGHVSMGLDDVLSDLGTLGYACQAFVIPACAVGAVHRRDRLWLVANATDMQRNGCNDNARELMGREQVPESGDDCWPADVAHSKCGARETVVQRQLRCLLRETGGRRPAGGFSLGDVSIGAEWASEPGVGRVADGIPNRAHRLKALGNAVVPAIPEMIGHAILESMRSA